MYKTATITAANQWTESLALIGFFNYSVQGTFVGTVPLQRSFDNGGTWEEVDSNTSPCSLVGFEPFPPYVQNSPTVLYRIGSSLFTSGEIFVRLGI